MEHHRYPGDAGAGTREARAGEPQEPSPFGDAPWGSEELGWPADPFPAYRRAQVRGAVCETRLRSGRRVWLVTGFAAAKRALADPRLSTDGRRFYRSYWGRPSAGDDAAEGVVDSFAELDGPPAAGGAAAADGPPAAGGAAAADGLDEMSLVEHMLSTDPPDHTRLRRLVSQAFTPTRVESMRPRVAEIATGLADRLGGRRRADLIEDFAFPLPLRVICELLGIPAADRDRFRGWFRTMLVIAPEVATRRQAQAAALEVAAYLSDLLAAKRAAPEDDLVSALVAARDGEEVLSEGELMSMVFLLLLAGHETTVNLVGNGVVSLLDHPEELAVLRERPNLIPAAVEELLRFDGPVHHPTFRFTLEPVTLGGAEIPAGEIVLVSLGAANRDPARFTQPDRLDVTRPVGQHLAFGHGPHFCLGAPLARLEGTTALSLLLQRFPDLRLAAPREELRWREGIFLRGLESLPVFLRP